MTLEQLYRNVEDRVFTLGRRFLRDDPTALLREEIDRVSAELQEEYAAAAREEEAAASARVRIADAEVREGILESHVEAAVSAGDQYIAWHKALDLDHTRQRLAADRAELPRAEAAARRHREQVARLEYRLGLLQARLNARLSARRSR